MITFLTTPGVEAEELQALGRAAQKIPTSARGGLGIEARVDDESLLLADGDPDEIIHPDRAGVWVAADEDLIGAPLHGGIADGVDFERLG